MEKKKPIIQEPSLDSIDTLQLKAIKKQKSHLFFETIVPLSQKSKSARKKKNFDNQQLFYPKWNNDGLCYTPSFIIPQDMIIFQKLKNSFKQGYEQQIESYSKESTNIPIMNINKPFPQDQSYCGVCKSSYMNFQQHTKSISHKKNCLNSPYTKHIHQLCQQVIHQYILYDSIEPKQQTKIQEFSQIQCFSQLSGSTLSNQNSINSLLPVPSKQLNSDINNQQFSL